MSKILSILSYRRLPVKHWHSIVAAGVVSLILLLKQFTNHLINQYDYSFSWFDISIKLIVNYGVWVLVLPFAFLISKLIRGRWWNPLNVTKLLFSSMLLAMGHRIVVLRISDFLYFLESGYLKRFIGLNNLTALNAGFFSSLIELWVIIGLFIGLDYQKRFISQQQELARAQLNALRMQLQPHFLFNTLHSISSMIDLDVKKAQKMITKLGALLRNVLENDQRQLVTLQEELEFINQYLALEQIRFQEHISIKHEYSPELFEAKVPSLILQPLVENAIKHGTISDDAKSEIIVHIETMEVNGKWLIMEIINTTTNQNRAEAKNKLGIGLRNVKNRLIQLYAESKFELIPHASNGMIARITIPYQT